ncbi:adenylate kinase [Eubacterium aggregans]|uniref:adenylate kinase n=2 Tax=Eubacterium aggregans TaxID=81409 RepID=UPI003F2E4D2D
MRVVLLGPPGAGKGTQAKGIAEKFNISHISTGDLFRENLKNETPLGKKAKAYMDAGKLVPDELVIAIVEDRIIREDCKDGYLLDGFPRTVAQASALCAFNEKIGKLLDYAVNIEVPEGLLVERIVGRRVCQKCGFSYHVTFNPPKVDGICDIDGEALIQRADDSEETVKTRLAVYHSESAPLVDFYHFKDKLINIDGNQSPRAVAADIETALKGSNQ